MRVKFSSDLDDKYKRGGQMLSLSMIPRQTLRLEQKMILCPPRVDGIKGTLQNLVRVLTENPQKMKRSVCYALAGGWATELFTGRSRTHKDIDIVVLDDYFEVETDNQRPESYFGQLSMSIADCKRDGVMSIDTNLLLRREQGFEMDGLVAWVDFVDPCGEVVIARPELIAVAKLSGGWGGEPCRNHDIEDSLALLTKGPQIIAPAMSEDSSRFAFKHLIGLPSREVEAFTAGFLKLNRRVFHAPLSVAEREVMEFHEQLRERVAPNRQGGQIER
ncbi:MAG: hypothetical protein ABIE84_00970 [bacterium]